MQTRSWASSPSGTSMLLKKETRSSLAWARGTAAATKKIAKTTRKRRRIWLAPEGGPAPTGPVYGFGERIRDSAKSGSGYELFFSESIACGVSGKPPPAAKAACIAALQARLKPCPSKDRDSDG